MQIVWSNGAFANLMKYAVFVFGICGIKNVVFGLTAFHFDFRAAVAMETPPPVTSPENRIPKLTEAVALNPTGVRR